MFFVKVELKNIQYVINTFIKLIINSIINCQLSINN